MADETTTISITVTPVSNPDNEVLSAFLPIIFEVQSTAPSLLNSRVQAIVKHGVALDTIGTIKQDQITVGGTPLFRFNVSDLLRAKLNEDVLDYNQSNDIQTGGELSTQQFRITFQKIFEDEFGLIIIQESINSLIYFVTNAIVQPQTSPQDLLTRTLSAGAKLFLTDGPNNKPINPNTEEEQLSFIGGAALISFQLRYQTYNLAGAPNAEQFLPTKVLINHHGIININKQTILSGFAAISKVDVWVRNTSTGVQASEKKTFVVKDNCDFELVRLQWLNSHGGIDEFSFENRKTRIQEFKRGVIQKALPLNYGVESEGRATRGVTSKEKLIISSGFQTKEYMDWFRQLLETTHVFWHVNFTTKYAVVITSQSMPFDDKDELQELVLELEISRDRITRDG